jgi:hypothetical protein
VAGGSRHDRGVELFAESRKPADGGGLRGCPVPVDRGHRTGRHRCLISIGRKRKARNRSENPDHGP